MVKIVQLKTKIIKKKIWNLCEKLFFTPKHQSFYQLEFNIGKDMWKHINHQKINLLIDRNIAVLYNKMMHNLLSCRKICLSG